ncbi:hypothetical protein CWB58_01415 [Pseudoalteromonas sp. S201]|nr:hypothetical protein CWB81_14845 [Pseudoalteromonas sp. S1688]TMS95101.1 hypothetical protein CWB58_01415 [Pseudoalteromonas sp. S201]
MFGAPWGSKGRSAVAAPWLPPAIWQETLNKVSNLGHGFIQAKVSNLQKKQSAKLIQLFGLKPNLQTTHASKLSAYGDTYYSCVKSHMPKERPTYNAYLRAWEMVMILENRWVSFHSTQPT